MTMQHVKDNKRSRTITLEMMKDYEEYLRREERSVNTIAKYARDLRAFFSFTAGNLLDKELVIQWKEKLTGIYAPASVNSMLAAVNGFLDWRGMPQCKVKPLKIQKAIFARPEKELSREEYLRLLRAARERQGQRLPLLLQTICSTGIRVSELCFITVEAVRVGRAQVNCKGKMRTVFLTKELCRVLCRYCREQMLETGPVFCTRNGKALDRSNIWREMKALCLEAGVDQGKVFPHNLRHLFARTYYSLEKDISRLADILGHTNVNTTRIYTMESGREHAKQMERMHLVSAVE